MPQNGSGNGSVVTFEAQLVAALKRDFNGTRPLRAEITGSKDNLTVTINIDVAESVAETAPILTFNEVLYYPPAIAQLVALLAQKSHVTVKQMKIRAQAGASNGQCNIFNKDGFTPDNLKDPGPATPRPKPIPLSQITDPEARRRGVQSLLRENQPRQARRQDGQTKKP